MESLSQMLGAFGFLGILAAIVLGFVMLLVLPWLALIECVRSDRDSGIKAFLVVALVVTWGLGSLVYGLFLTRSRALRVVTLGGLLLFLAVAVPSAVSFGTGMKMAADASQEREQATIRQLQEDFRPSVLAPDTLEPFPAIHFVHDGSGPRAATLATFTREGPQASGARDIDVDVRHVVHDAANDRFFAVTRHEFGMITRSTGRFIRIEVDPTLDEFGYPVGVVFDADEQKVVIVTSHVYTRFYRYDPRISDWERLPTELRDVSVAGLAYDPDAKCLYAFERETSTDLALRKIHRFGMTGASLGSIVLDPPIPLARDLRDLMQLRFNAGKLVAILPPFDAGAGNRIFAIDPKTGQVFAPA